MTNNIPNFDAMTANKLMSFWSRYNRPNRKDAAELIGDKRPGYTTLCGTLAAYASNKAAAMQCRERGDILAAEVYELICDRIFEKVPEDLRW